jgi:predicted transcriptional regulator
MKAGAAVLPPLGDLELAVLEQLWCGGEEDVQTVHFAVGKQRGISPNTVGSALERLFKKGLVSREKVSHAFRYRATLDRETFRARRVAEAVGGLSKLAERGVLAAFVDLLATSDEKALASLEELIQARRKGREA